VLTSSTQRASASSAEDAVVLLWGYSHKVPCHTNTGSGRRSLVPCGWACPSASGPGSIAGAISKRAVTWPCTRQHADGFGTAAKIAARASQGLNRSRQSVCRTVDLRLGRGQQSTVATVPRSCLLRCVGWRRLTEHRQYLQSRVWPVMLRLPICCECSTRDQTTARR